MKDLKSQINLLENELNKLKDKLKIKQLQEEIEKLRKDVINTNLKKTKNNSCGCTSKYNKSPYKDAIYARLNGLYCGDSCELRPPPDPDLEPWVVYDCIACGGYCTNIWHTIS